MGKSGSGGGGSSGGNIFTTNITGPPPGPSQVGSLLWIDLGVIPTGSRIWFGSLQCGGPSKSLTFEVRSNLAGKSAGTDGDTVLQGSKGSSTRGTATLDMYANGTLHKASVIGTGVEHFWIKVRAKSSTPGDYFYSLNYTLE